MKVESCQTLRRILDVFFALTNFRGLAFRKLHTRYALRHVDWRKFHEDTPTRSGVIVAHTLTFRHNINFHDYLLGGWRSKLGYALGCFGQSLACVKISGHSTP